MLISKTDTCPLINTVVSMYQKAFGDNYKYTNCLTNEENTLSWKEALIETLHLVYMRKKQDDICPIIKMVEKL